MSGDKQENENNFKQQNLPLSWDAAKVSPNPAARKAAEARKSAGPAKPVPVKPSETETPSEPASGLPPQQRPGRTLRSGVAAASEKNSEKQPQTEGSEKPVPKPAPVPEENPKPQAVENTEEQAPEVPASAEKIPESVEQELDIAEASVAEEPVKQKTGLHLSAAQEMMECRAAKNLSVLEVSEKTRVPKEFVQNLEEQRYNRLPPIIYTKSYVKMLCELYGLKSDEMLSRLLDELPDSLTDTQARLVVTSDNDDTGARIQYHIGSDEIPSKGLIGNLSLPRLITITGIAAIFLVVLIAMIVQFSDNRGAPAVTEGGEAESLGTEAAVEAVENQFSIEEDLDNFRLPQQLLIPELEIPNSSDSSN